MEDAEVAIGQVFFVMAALMPTGAESAITRMRVQMIFLCS
jgi:hypothetical protein